MSKPAIDRLTLIEAAHDVVTSDEAWAAKIADALLPELDDGFGVVAYMVHATRPGSLWEVGAGSIPGGLLDAVREISKAAEHFHPVFARPLISTVSELAPEVLDGSPISQRIDAVRAQYWEPLGLKDMVGMVHMADPEHMFVLAAPLRKTQLLTTERKRRLQRYYAHISHALRLRHEMRAEQAVLRPDGTLEHAEGIAKKRGQREILRQLAVQLDRAKSSHKKRHPDEAAAFWDALIEGHWSLVERFESDGRRYFVACKNRPDLVGLKALNTKERQVVELAAKGQSNKAIANVLSLSEPTISHHMSRALKKLGLRTRAELATLLAGIGKLP